MRILLALTLVLAFAGQSSAAMVTLSTDDSKIGSGFNQGWWSNNPGVVNTEGNTSIFTGALAGADLRSFYTFDLNHASLTGATIVSAQLAIVRSMNGTNEAIERLGFYEVTTSALTLNNTAGFDSAIYADLGTGTSYGEFDVAGSGAMNEVLTFNLNSSAIADLQAGIGNGYLSIGGAMLSSDGINDAFFAGMPGQVVELTIDFTSVPEPSAFAPLLLGWLGLTRRRRQTA